MNSRPSAQRAQEAVLGAQGVLIARLGVHNGCFLGRDRAIASDNVALRRHPKSRRGERAVRRLENGPRLESDRATKATRVSKSGQALDETWLAVRSLALRKR